MQGGNKIPNPNSGVSYFQILGGNNQPDPKLSVSCGQLRARTEQPNPNASEKLCADSEWKQSAQSEVK